ncbi:DinB family protein [Paenibacillus rhizoplanae]
MNDDVEEQELELLKYPIGRFAPKGNRTAEVRAASVAVFRQLGEELRAAVEPLTAEQQHTPYRPGGWTVVQVVHHLADTGMYAYLRFKRGADGGSTAGSKLQTGSVGGTGRFFQRTGGILTSAHRTA